MSNLFGHSLPPPPKGGGANCGQINCSLSKNRKYTPLKYNSYKSFNV